MSIDISRFIHCKRTTKNLTRTRGFLYYILMVCVILRDLVLMILPFSIFVDKFLIANSKSYKANGNCYFN